jgi:mono/diheme cytochrome c family protein
MQHGMALALSAILLAGSASAWAAGSGDAERGRAIFNGKGICSYCHGTDGRPDQRPQLSKETADVVARLAPAAPNLRDAKHLRLKTDRERTKIIREGHTGTGMLPDTTLADREVADILAYLAKLRVK